ncbi:MAG: FecR domain-containing protein [Verrucomicrobiota bacterium]
MNTAEKAYEAIEAAAAAWLARRDRGLTAEEAQAFAQWRAADARHEAAVAELESVWTALDDLLVVDSQQQQAGGIAAMPPAVQREGREAITPIATPRKRPVLVRWWPALGLAAVLAILVGAVVWRNGSSAGVAEARYATTVGEQRTVVLPDGSEVLLNTDTVVNVHFEGKRRAVTLERGEAFFRVTKDAARPFVVAVGRAEARVVGTAFSVRLREAGSEVLVAEGRVRFGATGGAGQGVELGARQFASVQAEGNGMPRVTVLDGMEVSRRLAWLVGDLYFTDTPLSEVVMEFNRYHRRPLVLRDPATAGMPVGGKVKVDNRAGFLNLLKEGFDIVIVPEAKQDVVLGPRP